MTTERRKRVRLKYYHFGEDGVVTGETEKGARFEIVFEKINAHRAQCAIGRLAQIIAADIVSERRRHRWIRGKVAEAHNAIDRAIREE